MHINKLLSSALNYHEEHMFTLTSQKNGSTIRKAIAIKVLVRNTKRSGAPQGIKFNSAVTIIQ